MQSAVIYILNQEKQRFSNILLIILIIMQIMFQRLILSFDLIVNLQMKSNI